METVLDDRTMTTNTRGASERLGVAPATLRNWRWRGEGPKYVKMGRTVRYRLVDLVEWLETQTRTSTSNDER